MGRYLRYFSGRKFGNIFEPTNHDEVKKKLGMFWRKLVPRLLVVVEYLEDLNPTDEDAGVYEEFRLANENPEICRMLKTFDWRTLKKIAMKIGLLKRTNENFSIGFFPQSYIYNPAVGEILEDLQVEIRHTRPAWEMKWTGRWTERRKARYGDNWQATGKIYHDFPDAPECADDLRRIFHTQYHRVSRALVPLVDYLESLSMTDESAGEYKEFLLDAKCAGVDKFKLKHAIKAGLLHPTHPDDNKKLIKRYIFNPQAARIIRELAAWTKPIRRHRVQGARQRHGLNEAHIIRKDEDAAAPFTGVIFDNIFPPVDADALQSRFRSLNSRSRQNLLAFVETMESLAMTDERTGEYREFIMTFKDFKGTCKKIHAWRYMLYHAAAMHIIMRTDGGKRIGKNGGKMVYNPAAARDFMRFLMHRGAA